MRSERALRQRGTERMAPVVVAQENSSEVWHAFRVARRARLRDVTFSADPRRLRSGRPMTAMLDWAAEPARASWQLAGALRIEESIQGLRPCGGAFSLDPQLTLSARPDSGYGANCDDERTASVFRFSQGAALDVYGPAGTPTLAAPSRRAHCACVSRPEAVHHASSGVKGHRANRDRDFRSLRTH